ncbi:hypothetical protein NM208_g11498 [Fusarium decemcellulare]|uniref:Uncharacterized protein n=1 Tax=Fusarium decemcellulare TaxID=57161 RepID=A0ACC1RSP0_9HYPO|nr:hypothetical protein NM208_g11498 [Fusarium decemcellulare]
MSSYFISGASRGLGLGIAAALAAKPASEVSIVFAGVRTETDAVKQLVKDSAGRIELVRIDATSKDSVKQAASQVTASLGDKGLDVLLNVAGVLPLTPDGIDTMDDLESVFSVNVTSTHLVTSALLPLLKKGNLKKVINFTSTFGSIEWAPAFMHVPAYAYKVAKAALNMLTVQYAHSLKEEGFTFVAVSPGWVKTELGGPYAVLELDTGVKATLDIVFNLKKEDNGKFLNVRVPGFEDVPTPDRFQGGQPPW